MLLLAVCALLLGVSLGSHPELRIKAKAVPLGWEVLEESYPLHSMTLTFALRQRNLAKLDVSPAPPLPAH